MFTEKRKVSEEQPNPQKPTTQSRQRGAQTTSAHLHWCGANPPSSWPAHVADHKGDPPKRDYIFAIFAGFSKCTVRLLLMSTTSRRALQLFFLVMFVLKTRLLEEFGGFMSGQFKSQETAKVSAGCNFGVKNIADLILYQHTNGMRRLPIILLHILSSRSSAQHSQ